MAVVRNKTPFLFDLDGTLIDSVYQHVLAWKSSLDAEGIPLSVWRIHRKIGMSGGLFANILLRETGFDNTPERLERLRVRHAQAYLALSASVQPLPGARAAARLPDRAGHAVGDRHQRAHGDRRTPPGGARCRSGRVPVVTRDQVKYAKPDPDLFLTAAERLGVDIRESLVLGDSIWDMIAAQRARALGVGLLSGGYGEDELSRAGAFRVYEDPADLLDHIDEIAARG